MVWYIRLKISNFRKNLVYFDLFILILLEKHDLTQKGSRIMNQLLEVLLRLKNRNLHGSYLIYNHVVRLSVILSILVLYKQSIICRVKTSHCRSIFLFCLSCVASLLFLIIKRNNEHFVKGVMIN